MHCRRGGPRSRWRASRLPDAFKAGHRHLAHCGHSLIIEHTVDTSHISFIYYIIYIWMNEETLFFSFLNLTRPR